MPRARASAGRIRRYRNPIYTRTGHGNPYGFAAIMAPFRHNRTSRSALLFRPYSSALSRNVSIAREKLLARARASERGNICCVDPFPQKSYPHELHLDYTILPFRLFGCLPAPTRPTPPTDDRLLPISVRVCTHGNCRSRMKSHSRG